MTDLKEAVWTERYRPATIDDVLLPPRLKTQFKAYVESNSTNIPNLILEGPAGGGKTTIAKALLNELGCEYIVINASMFGNIDTLRTNIQQFATTSSFSGRRKFVILDEADYLNATSTQPALRNFMEACHENCGFILTCNHINRIIPELRSRCGVVTFDIRQDEQATMKALYFKRLIAILTENNVKYDNQAVVELVVRKFPDFRSMINMAQMHSKTGINASIFSTDEEGRYQQIISFIKSKEFTKLRTWVGENSAFVYDQNFFTGLYKALLPVLKPSAVGTAIVIIAEFMYRQSFVVDKEINAMAAFSQLMQEAQFS